MDDAFSVELIEVGNDPRFEFFLGCDANAAGHGARHLGEEAFDKIEPGTMFRSKYIGETALWLGGNHALVSLEMCAEWLSRISLMAVSVG
jgi:hypothetical protein